MPNNVVDRGATADPEQNQERIERDGAMSRRDREFEVRGAQGPARRGGEAAEDVSLLSAEPAPLPRGRLSWGGIWAGVLATFAIFFMLEFLVYAAGFTTFQVHSNTVTETGVPWVTGLVLLISIFVGGWLSAATLSKHGEHIGDLDGMLEGFVVWALLMS